MCVFALELETVIKGFVDNEESFTSLMIRDGLRDEFSLPCKYKEANYETLTHMQHNGADYGYVARPHKVVVGQDILGQDEHIQVWEFVPAQTIVDELETKPSGGLFSRLFGR